MLGADNGWHPMFSREMLIFLRDSNLLQRHWVSEALDNLRVPTQLVQILDLRLNALPRRVLDTLTACAVRGSTFAPDAIAAMMGETEPTSLDLLEVGLD